MVLLKLFPALLLLLGTAVLDAAEPEPFRSELFFAPSPIHIQHELDREQFEAFRSRKDVPGLTGRFSVAPEFHGKLRHLGRGTLYDVRGIMRGWGLTLPAGSVAVADPEAKLVFVRSTPSDMEIADACMEMVGMLPQMISFDVQITAKSGERGEQRLFLGKGIGTQTGQTAVLNSAGEAGENASSVELAVEAFNEPTGKSVKVNLEGRISHGSSQSRIATLFTAENGKAAITELSLNETTTAVLEFTFRQKSLGLPEELESEETKKRVIAEIEADLLKTGEPPR